MKLRVASLLNDSIVDGPGLRFAVYVQGCSHRCPGCHNPQTHDFDGGFEADTEEIWARVAENPLLDGITFSGGDPMFQPRPLTELAKKARAAALSVWCYTGYTIEELFAEDDDDIAAFLRVIDVVVDGPFLQEQRTLELPYRGSANQRLIDVAASLHRGAAVEVASLKP